MTLRVSSLVLLLLAALSGIGLAWLGRDSGSGLGGLALSETQASDWLFRWRQSLHPQAVPIDPRIVLVAIDDETLQELDKPDLFWDEDLAAVTQALLDAKAAVVGIDTVRNFNWGHAPQVVSDLVNAAQNDMIDCVLSDRVVLIELVDGNVRKSWAQRIVDNAGQGRNSGLANLENDPDGVIRRVPFVVDDTGSAHLFSARIAEIAAGENASRGPSWTFRSRPLVLENQALRINYPGPAGVFPQISLAQLLRRLKNHQSFQDFEGKIVIIEPHFVTDTHPTPTMRQDGRLPVGAEIHAAAINTMLSGKYLQIAPFWAWGLAGGAVSCVVFALFAYLPVTWAAFLTVVGAPLYYLGCLQLFAVQGWIMPLLGPALGSLLSASLGLFERFWSSERSRQRAQSILSRMVSPQVASLVLRGSDIPTLGGRRQPLTVLFSDINQFTPTCEKLEPEQVIVMLNEYFSEMVAIIHAHRGYVKQFVGDEIMAIFGAPEHFDDHPRQAVLCAVAMLERLQALKEKAGDKPGFHSVKIGIHTGLAVVGQVGSLERSEYAAVGDDVNLAARLESKTTALGVSNLVSPSTKASCGDCPEGWRWQSMGNQQFKGKTIDMEVWTLVMQSRTEVSGE